MSKKTVTICVITQHGNVYNEAGQEKIISMICPPFDKNDEFIFLMGAVYRDPKILIQEMEKAENFVVACPDRDKEYLHTSTITDKEGFTNYLLNPPDELIEYTTYELMQYLYDGME